MFAGPNGSGKTTIKSVIPDRLLGIYVNPDEIEQTIRDRGYLDLAAFGVEADAERIHAFLSASPLLERAGLLEQAAALRFEDGKLHFGDVAVNAYVASVLADFMRRHLLASGTSFTFETVMSSPDKVDFLGEAQRRGFRTYLYYVATDDPIINISRVRNRVAMGGHPVPEEKIRSRYHRSLALLAGAIRHTDRAYLFDNSGAELIWLAEVEGGTELKMKVEQMPAWFKKAAWDEMQREAGR